MVVPTAQAIKVQLYAAWGDTAGSEDRVLNYNEASTTTGNRKVTVTKEYAASATNQSLDLSTFVDTATWIILVDRGGVGFNVGLVSGGTKMQVAGNGVLMFKNANATPPTLYFDNPSASLATYIEVNVLGASA